MSALAGSSSANLQTRYAFPRPSASVSMIVLFTFSKYLLLLFKYALLLLFAKRSYFSCQIHLTIPVRNTSINMEDLSENPPTEINPYEVLEIETTATPSNVKSAYKKLALRHHPGIPNLSLRATSSLHPLRQSPSRRQKRSQRQIPRNRLRLRHPLRRTTPKAL